MAVFLAFDVLDLDGSRLETRHPQNTLVAETTNPEIERSLYPAPDALRTSGVQTPFLLLFPKMASTPPVTTFLLAKVRARLHAVRPRLHTERIQQSPPASAGDPA
jgi:hypothetical protein